ncbi:hypothetical protein C8F01DRAFT_1369361 [Mycena amicta]|nr:hypothetical protein C8F01DRAFT_1369361 [Mycena amicta]
MPPSSVVVDKVPNEIWLAIFGLLKDLHNIVLVSRKFHALGTEPLVRHITWKSAALAEQHLQFWRRSGHKVHLVRSVAVVLPGAGGGRDQVDESIATYDRIFRQIGRFTRLRHLKLCGGKVPEVLYTTLEKLPTLTDLTLEGCSIPSPPAQLSDFFRVLQLPPGTGTTTTTTPVIQVKRLTVLKLKRAATDWHMLTDSVSIPLVYRLPHLRSFVTDSLGIQIPTDVSAKLTSLTLVLAGPGRDMQDRLDALLHRMPQLTQLHVSVDASSYNASLSGQANPANILTHAVVTLPHLLVVSAPWPAAVFAMRGALATVQHLRINTPVAKNSDILTVLELIRSSGVPLRSMAFRIAAWDDEVLLAAARCLPASCEALEVAYYDGEPGENFLFNLGIHHLPLLPFLRTLRLVPLPPEMLASSPLRFRHVQTQHMQPQPLMVGHTHGPILGQTFIHLYLVPPGQGTGTGTGAQWQWPVPAGTPAATTWLGAGPGTGTADDSLALFPDHDSDLPQSPSSSSASSSSQNPNPNNTFPTEEELATAEPLREAVCVWARYNPHLERVRLGKGKGGASAWVRVQLRKGVGEKAVWVPDGEGKEAQRERWEDMMMVGVGVGVGVEDGGGLGVEDGREDYGVIQL